MSDIQSDEIAKGVKYLQFKPSNRMNGCFVALLTRDVIIYFVVAIFILHILLFFCRKMLKLTKKLVKQKH